jgi:hypothetical protein
MTAAGYSLLAALIFALVAVAQAVRAALAVPVTLGRTAIPVWASWLACVVAAILAWLGFSAA